MNEHLTKEKADAAYKWLKEKIVKYDVVELCNVVLDDPRFKIWSGASFPAAHHYGDYGLIIHTAEVTRTSLEMADMYPQYIINRKTLFLAGLFHDSGKMDDYKKVGEAWGWTDHKNLIHHISRSAIIWNSSISILALMGLPKEFTHEYKNSVTHAILSHHGQKEWGSPVSPQTREAWILHLCDQMSARLYDNDTLERKS